MTTPHLLPLGPDGILVRFSERLEEPANRAALAFRATVDALGVPGVSETASSLTSVYLRFRPDQQKREALLERLSELIAQRDWMSAPLPQGRTLWHMPATFEGDAAPDLADVADRTGQTVEQAVADIASQTLRVLALGFAPGQPYLGFMPPDWDIPRRTDVTPQVPQGAIVVAVRQVIPFSNPSPTGWRQIGRTAFRCYDPAAATPLPLKAGDEIRFQSIAPGALEKLATDARGGAETEAL